MKKIFFPILLILLVIPLVSAGNYGAGKYGAGLYGIGEVPEEEAPAAAVVAGGGGGGAAPITEPEILFDVKILEFDTVGGEFIDQLFDITFLLEDSIINSSDELRAIVTFESFAIEPVQIKLGGFFNFTYFIKGVGDVNDDVTLDFKIEQNEEVITTGSDIIYLESFEEKTETARLFLPKDLSSGNYKFIVRVTHGNYTVESHRTINITVSEEEVIIIPAIDLTFIILDENGNKIHREKDSITVETEKVLRKTFKGLNLPEGKYTLILETLYNVDVFDEFRQNFEIRIVGKREFRWYLIYILIALAILIILRLLYLERERLGAGIMPVKEWIKKYERSVLLVLLLLLSLIILAYYLNWFELIAGWGRGKISLFVSALLTVLVIFIVIFIIVAKKKKPKKPNRKVKKVETQVIEKKEKIENHENMKLFFEKYKILLSIILLSVILAGVIGYLFYAGILTVGQLQNLWNSIVKGLIIGYNATADWIIRNWLYLTIGAGIVALGFISYLVREQLVLAGKWIRKDIENHKIAFAAGVGIIIGLLIAIIAMSFSLIIETWDNVVYYLSLVNPYFYYIVGSIIGLIILIAAIIAAKKKRSFEKSKKRKRKVNPEKQKASPKEKEGKEMGKIK